MKLWKAHFSSGAVLVVVAESMTAAHIKAEYQADTFRILAHRNIGNLVRVELDLDGEES
jgi:hypothetical protein